MSRESGQIRRRVATEAARLIAEHGLRDFQHAKRKAAERLGVHDEASLPRNREIEDALREHQRLFQADSQPAHLQTLREAAVEAMRFFGRFEPRLVGAVLDGSADRHSAVCLHLFDDDPREVELFLRQNGIPFEVRTRRLRFDAGRAESFPVYVFAADEVPVDLTVLPLDALRQAPLDRHGDAPMARANLGAAQTLAHQKGSAGKADGA